MLKVGEVFNFESNRGHDDWIPVVVTEQIVALIERFGMPVGCGGSRMVFDMGNGFVFKFEHGGEVGEEDDPFQFQNQMELEVFDAFGHLGILLPVQEIEIDGLRGLRAPICDAFYVSKRTVRKDPKEYGWLTGALFGYEPRDSYQCGIWEGRIYLLDYAIESRRLAEFFGC